MKLMITASLRSTLFTLLVTIISHNGYGQTPQAPIPQGAIVVNLDANSALRLDQQRMDLNTLSDRLHNTPSGATVVVVAAPSVAFKELVTIVDTVRAAGIERVGILKAQADRSVKESLPPLGATVLTVDRSGVIKVDGHKTKLSNIASQLQKAFKSHNDRTVYVEAYGALSFDAVGDVIDAAKQAGASRIALLAANN
jgi:biopolymer transport protein ExbD